MHRLVPRGSLNVYKNMHKPENTDGAESQHLL